MQCVFHFLRNNLKFRSVFSGFPIQASRSLFISLDQFKLVCGVTGLVAGLLKVLALMCRDKHDPPFRISTSSLKLELIDTGREFQLKVL